MGLVTRKPTKSIDKIRWRSLTIAQRESQLRSRATPSELKLITTLNADSRTRGRYSFQKHLLGCYPDFLFRAAKLIVELDGACHSSARAKAADSRRTRKLAKAGYRVIRFWNSEMRHPELVMARICGMLEPGPVITFD